MAPLLFTLSESLTETMVTVLVAQMFLLYDRIPQTTQRVTHLIKGKGKAIPLQAWTGL